MKIIVLGCGRVGSHLATALAAAGHHVTVIDHDPRAFTMLGDDLTDETRGAPGPPRLVTGHSKITCVLGLGIDEEVLAAAGLASAEAFAAVTDSDYTNIMASLIAREIHALPRVIARISDPKRERIFHELGLETICPTTLGAQSVFTLLEKPAMEAQAPPSSSPRRTR